MATTDEEKEQAFAEELRRYEDKWVAIHQSEGSETIVGSGSNGVAAVRDAKAKGFHDTVLLKVLPFDKSLHSLIFPSVTVENLNRASAHESLL